jgi:hypothetical protein
MLTKVTGRGVKIKSEKYGYGDESDSASGSDDDIDEETSSTHSIHTRTRSQQQRMMNTKRQITRGANGMTVKNEPTPDYISDNSAEMDVGGSRSGGSSRGGIVKQPRLLKYPQDSRAFLPYVDEESLRG